MILLIVMVSPLLALDASKGAFVGMVRSPSGRHHGGVIIVRFRPGDDATGKPAGPCRLVVVRAAASGVRSEPLIAACLFLDAFGSVWLGVFGSACVTQCVRSLRYLDIAIIPLTADSVHADEQHKPLSFGPLAGHRDMDAYAARRPPKERHGKEKPHTLNAAPARTGMARSHTVPESQCVTLTRGSAPRKFARVS